MSSESLAIDIKSELLPDASDVKTELWWVNPWNYIRQVRDNSSQYNTYWHKGLLTRRNINPNAYLNLHLGINSGWRAIVADDRKNIATLYVAGERKPQAVWPMWSAELHAPSRLKWMIENPYEGSNYGKDFSRREFRPVSGQQHRIIVYGLGGMQHSYWRGVYLQVMELQEEYPEVNILVPNVWSYDLMFNRGLKAVGVDPLILAIKAGCVVLPSGKKIALPDKELAQRGYWLEVLGWTYDEVNSSNYNMTCYNIHSLEWASRYYTELAKHAPVYEGRGSRYKTLIDWRSPEAKDFLRDSRSVYTHRLKHKPTDKIACDQCSLWSTCRYYRKGSVCSVPDSEMKKVASMFGSRDADKIVDAMGILLKKSVRRIERGLEAEELSDDQELSPELTKIINSTMSNAEKLAKLRNPDLAGGKPSVVINNQQNTMAGITPAGMLASSDSSIAPAVAAHIINQLEAQGYKREEITEDLIQDYLLKLTTNTTQYRPRGLEISSEVLEAEAQEDTHE